MTQPKRVTRTFNHEKPTLHETVSKDYFIKTPVGVEQKAASRNRRSLPVNKRCPSPLTDSSSLVMTLNPLLSPDVTMSVDNNPICDGDLATFTVTDSTDAGSEPPFGDSFFAYPEGRLAKNCK